jgi:hypothetical protein
MQDEINNSCFSIERWASAQKESYGSRDGLDQRLEKIASQFDPAGIGLSGSVIQMLFDEHPRMIPRLAWGGSIGWRSAKRLKRWQTLLARSNVPFVGNFNGVLVRFIINAAHWVPHPYCPPAFCLADQANFRSYIVDNDEAWELCQRWRVENSVYITNALKARLAGLSVHFGASYRCYNEIDYAEVAFWSENAADEIALKTAWKRENSMASLIARFFPDCVREHSPQWLGGQRIDVFVPSINVAFEYQGEQHHQAVDYFGGADGLIRTKERDRRKKVLCAQSGVTLIEWHFYERISEELLFAKLAEFGITDVWRRNATNTNNVEEVGDQSSSLD